MTFFQILSNINTNNITNMIYIFYNCSKKSSLSDISNWNINNVINMSCMYYDCSIIIFT